jgi:hypothetical protein
MVTNRLKGTDQSFAHGRKEEFKTLDVDKMLAELRLEREQIEEAILTLERLARGRGRRRGRPPAWLKDAAAASSSPSENGNNEESDHPAEPKRRGRPPKARPMAQTAEN